MALSRGYFSDFLSSFFKRKRKYQLYPKELKIESKENQRNYFLLFSKI